jgi:hypothetical protein
LCLALNSIPESLQKEIYQEAGEYYNNQLYPYTPTGDDLELLEELKQKIDKSIQRRIKQSKPFLPWYKYNTNSLELSKVLKGSSENRKRWFANELKNYYSSQVEEYGSDN